MVSPFLLCQLLVLTLRGWPRWQWWLAWLTLIQVSHHQRLEKVNVALAIKWQIAVGSQCGCLLENWPLACGPCRSLCLKPSLLPSPALSLWQFCTGLQNWQLLCHSLISLLCVVTLDFHALCTQVQTSCRQWAPRSLAAPTRWAWWAHRAHVEVTTDWLKEKMRKNTYPSFWKQTFHKIEFCFFFPHGWHKELIVNKIQIDQKDWTSDQNFLTSYVLARVRGISPWAPRLSLFL